MLGQNNLRLLYYRYKDSPYLLLGSVVLLLSISLILFFRVIIPQFESWFSISNEVRATRERIATITQNITFMNNLDKNLLNTQVTVATSALPIEKDFGPIVNALSESAIDAGVSLEDFSFQVGNISSTSARLTNTDRDLESTKITVAVIGDVTAVQRFLAEITQKLPLAELTMVDGDIRATTVIMEFYQKPFPKITFKDDQPLRPLSEKNVSLLQEMALWQPAEVQEQEEASIGGVPLF